MKYDLMYFSLLLISIFALLFGLGFLLKIVFKKFMKDEDDYLNDRED